MNMNVFADEVTEIYIFLCEHIHFNETSALGKLNSSFTLEKSSSKSAVLEEGREGGSSPPTPTPALSRRVEVKEGRGSSPSLWGSAGSQIRTHKQEA